MLVQTLLCEQTTTLCFLCWGLLYHIAHLFKLLSEFRPALQLQSCNPTAEHTQLLRSEPCALLHTALHTLLHKTV
jgi:hypothetical protein